MCTSFFGVTVKLTKKLKKSPKIGLFILARPYIAGQRWGEFQPDSGSGIGAPQSRRHGEREGTAVASSDGGGRTPVLASASPTRHGNSRFLAVDTANEIACCH